MDLNTKLDNVIRSKACKLTPFKGAEEHKSFTISVDFTGAAVNDVIEKAVSGAVIQWQNANRDNYDKLKDKDTIKIQFQSSGKVRIDPMQALIAEAKAAGVDPADADALIAYVTKRAEALK